MHIPRGNLESHIEACAAARRRVVQRREVGLGDVAAAIGTQCAQRGLQRQVDRADLAAKLVGEVRIVAAAGGSTRIVLELSDAELRVEAGRGQLIDDGRQALADTVDHLVGRLSCVDEEHQVDR